jgi:hypothetical protein
VTQVFVGVIFESLLYQCSVHCRRYDFKVIHPRRAVDLIYIFTNIQSYTAPYASRLGDKFRLLQAIIRLSFKNHTIQHMTAVTKEIPSFTKYVLEIH